MAANVDLAVIAQIVTIVASLAAVGALWVGVVQMIEQNRQRHREFENLYVQRCW